MRISIPQILDWMGACGEGSGAINGWSIDSRTAQPGELFFALRGPNHDGHDFVDQLSARGVLSVVDVPAKMGPDRFLTDDTLRGLQRLARQARRSWGGRVVCVTGSAGKTTTKDLIAHFVAVRMPVGKTIGNFNNHVGLPLSILRLPDGCRTAVLEAGMNHAGEIRELATVAEPDVAVVTNVGLAHIEFFRDIQGIALAKRELIEALPASGTAILNADDPHVSRFASIHRGRVLTFGFSPGADVRGSGLEQTAEGCRFNVEGRVFRTPLLGRHGAMNVLAALACARTFDIELDELIEPARTIPVLKMRGERFDYNGITIFNDAYNANPDAVRSMIDVLADTPARRRIAVVGEMLELGHETFPAHRSLGAYAAKKGIDYVLGIRGAASEMVQSAVKAGIPAENALFFEDPAEAGTILRRLAQPGDVLLFKGSRGVRVERAIDAMLATSPEVAS